MRTPWIWSVSLGRWWNVHVRVHMFFFLFVALLLYMTSFFDEPHWLGFTCALVVLVSVLLHEIAHVVTARHMGGVADDIVLSPLGGLSPVRVPYEPHSELVAIMAGTLANLAICFCSALTLAIIEPEIPLFDLLHPTVSYLSANMEPTLVSVLKLTFWINWSLILVNLIPTVPFDGGRSLHAVVSFLWPELDPRQTMIMICRMGKIFAAVFLLLSWYYHTPQSAEPSAQPPLWFGCMLLAIYIYFNSRREEIQQSEIEQEDETVFGYDFSQGYTSLERSTYEDEADPFDTPPAPKLGLVARWLEGRRESQRQREIEQEREDDRRVDEVLEQLHQNGMRSLSAEDRALLERVSKRYRSRQS